MGYNFDDTDLASQAGKLSKRGPAKVNLNPRLERYMGDEGTKKLVNILKGLNGIEFVDAFTKIAPYIYPKLQAMKISADAEININIIHPDQKVIDGI